MTLTAAISITPAPTPVPTAPIYTRASAHPAAHTLTSATSAHSACAISAPMPRPHSAPIAHRASLEFSGAKSIQGNIASAKRTTRAPRRQQGLPDGSHRSLRSYREYTPKIATLSANLAQSNQGPQQADAADSILTIDGPDRTAMATPLHAKLEQIFAPFRNGDTEQNQKIEALIARIESVLLEQDISAEKLEQCLNNAERIDTVSAIFEGFVSASAFAIASTLAHLFAKNPSNIMNNAITGAWIGAFHAVLEPILHTASHVGHYTKVTPDKLDLALRQQAQLLERDNYSETSLQTNALTIPYTARNIAVALIDLISTAVSGKPLIHSNEVNLEHGLGPLAGAASKTWLHAREKHDGLRGPAYLLAADDLKPTLDKLQQRLMTTQRVKHGFSHLYDNGKAAIKAIPNAALQVLNPAGLTQMAVLATGLSLTQYLESSLSEADTEIEMEARKHLLTTVCLGTVYAAFAYGTETAKKYGWNELTWDRIGQAFAPQKSVTLPTDDVTDRAMRVIGRSPSSNPVQLTSISSEAYSITHL